MKLLHSTQRYAVTAALLSLSLFLSYSLPLSLSYSHFHTLSLSVACNTQQLWLEWNF